MHCHFAQLGRVEAALGIPFEKCAVGAVDALHLVSGEGRSAGDDKSEHDDGAHDLDADFQVLKTHCFPPCAVQLARRLFGRG